jgi:membrane protein YdbS with pleckstrin-like domain
MKDSAAETCRWIYAGVWGVMVDWFRLPPQPPTLPTSAGEQVESFGPSPAWLDYLKLKFWLGQIPSIGFLIAVFVGLSISLTAAPEAGVLVAIPIMALVGILTFLSAAISFVLLHLRYDTTWYVMTGRSLRIRRGVWTLHETTITFENVQNIRIDQGPLERYCGVANLLVETAGGGGGMVTLENAHAAQNLQFHRGLIEGVANAEELRELILSRLKHSQSGGLGDEGDEPEEHRAPPSAIPPAAAPSPFRREHMALLVEIRDLARKL